MNPIWKPLQSDPGKKRILILLRSLERRRRTSEGEPAQARPLSNNTRLARPPRSYREMAEKTSRSGRVVKPSRKVRESEEYGWNVYSPSRPILQVPKPAKVRIFPQTALPNVLIGTRLIKIGSSVPTAQTIVARSEWIVLVAARHTILPHALRPDNRRPRRRLPSNQLRLEFNSLLRSSRPGPRCSSSQRTQSTAQGAVQVQACRLSQPRRTSSSTSSFISHTKAPQADGPVELQFP